MNETGTGDLRLRFIKIPSSHVEDFVHFVAGTLSGPSGLTIQRKICSAGSELRLFV